MFELGTTDHWWEIAKRYPILSNHSQTLKPLGYAHMINLIEAFKPKTILEVGHGAGSFLFDLFKDKIEMWGLDDTIEGSSVSSDALKDMKDHNSHVKFVTGLLGQNLKELPDNYFDVVCSISVIEHIPAESLADAFAEIYRILKPGGIVSHSFDIYYRQNTRPVYNAYENANFEWLKPKEKMNVFWEDWIENSSSIKVEDLMSKIIFENPMIVVEEYMWKQERSKRLSPINYMTVLTGARKPSEKSDTKITNGNNEIKKILPVNFNEFTYSKRSHFEILINNNADVELLGYKINPDYCGIKSYQYLLVYNFLKNNIYKDAKILEIGGNYPILTEKIKNEYECWILKNLADQTGNKDIDPGTAKIKFIYDEIGNFNSELPDNYFDFVFSVSHFRLEGSIDKIKSKNILKDINRILKTGGYSLHCITTLWREPVIL
ncbi:MAG: methyltransferase domain-containing protein, partial [bacterium]